MKCSVVGSIYRCFATVVVDQVLSIGKGLTGFLEPSPDCLLSGFGF